MLWLVEKSQWGLLSKVLLMVVSEHHGHVSFQMLWLFFADTIVHRDEHRWLEKKHGAAELGKQLPVVRNRGVCNPYLILILSPESCSFLLHVLSFLWQLSKSCYSSTMWVRLWVVYSASSEWVKNKNRNLFWVQRGKRFCLNGDGSSDHKAKWRNSIIFKY